jgi:hypothetical protein
MRHDVETTTLYKRGNASHPLGSNEESRKCRESEAESRQNEGGLRKRLRIRYK